MKILVTGANGQLGRHIRMAAAGSCGGDEFVFADITAPEGMKTEILDITDSVKVRSFVGAHGIDVIVNCAAYTDVNAAESDEAAARRLNGDAPACLAAAMAETGGLMVHISTDYVFGGEPYNTPCSEDMEGTPTGVYGSTKLLGERNVMAAGCDYVIIRTSWLYSEFGRNFCKTMLDLTASKESLKVVFDQAGTPTFAGDLAAAVMAVLADYAAHGKGRPYARTGIYHYSNEGVCSWYDFAKMIQEYSGHTRCDIQPCHSGEFPSAVRRPSYSVLDKTKIKETFGIRIPYWTDSLRKAVDLLVK